MVLLTLSTDTTVIASTIPELFNITVKGLVPYSISVYIAVKEEQTNRRWVIVRNDRSHIQGNAILSKYFSFSRVFVWKTPFVS
jgi:hypothetical protein